MGNKIQVCISIEKIKYDKYVELGKKTGLPISRIIELELNGYKIEQIEQKTESKV